MARFGLFAAGAVAALMLASSPAAQASAGPSVAGDAQYILNATFADGATLTGNFYYNTTYGLFDYSAPWSITTTAGAADNIPSDTFAGYTYDTASTYYSAGSDYIDLVPNQTAQSIGPGPYGLWDTGDLHLQFDAPLNEAVATNGIDASASFECQFSFSCSTAGGGDLRYFTLDSTGPGSAAGSTPEPATWALMILGVGLVGGMARHGRAARGRPAG
ncbi:MAG TPA: PEPxxWA-CTERM sorting domain-containing protein [Caulobacteraceae bacterium]|jgi:hypothetical protein|nr:PEPxxWA-CTERM sorting domain-containing protein [Caulobacteraceae bacterium]